MNRFEGQRGELTTDPDHCQTASCDREQGRAGSLHPGVETRLPNGEAGWIVKYALTVKGRSSRRYRTTTPPHFGRTTTLNATA